MMDFYNLPYFARTVWIKSEHNNNALGPNLREFFFKKKIDPNIYSPVIIYLEGPLSTSHTQPHSAEIAISASSIKTAGPHVNIRILKNIFFREGLWKF